MHMDTAGPMPVQSIGRSRYFLMIKDDSTGFRTAYFMRSKDEAVENIIQQIIFMETQTGNKFKVLRSDCGTEFLNTRMEDFCASKGIIHETSAPYSPQQNGRAEREIWTIKDTGRTLLKSRSLPENLWAETVATAVYIRN